MEEKLTRLPGFCDVHVHFREPGFEYKETVLTGSMAAAHGGYTAVCPMPNLDPVPDSRDNIAPQLSAIERDAAVEVVPYGSISRGEKGEVLSDIEALAPVVCGFSDDGKGVDSEELMREAMLRAKACGRIIAAHCEDKTVAPEDSEWAEAERNIRLAKETGAKLHICHVSLKKTIDLIRKGKAEGADLTCETAPHYLLLDSSMVEDSGRFKMNPPIGSAEDREALIEALKDGTIDMIATDHAPHSAEEKAKGFKGSLSGIVGLETAFPALYTGLVKTGIISLEKLVELMAVNPRKRFGLELREDDYSLWNLEEKFTADSADFLSKGKSSPFTGTEYYGVNHKTVYRGKTVWQREQI